MGPVDRIQEPAYQKSDCKIAQPGKIGRILSSGPQHRDISQDEVRNYSASVRSFGISHRSIRSDYRTNARLRAFYIWTLYGQRAKAI